MMALRRRSTRWALLPIVVQIPVFIALYWVLLSAVELRHAPWIGWIKDLSAPDPYYILPVIYAITAWLQVKLSPTPITDPVQAKVFQIMPIAFSVLFIFFPSGLVLYWLVNNILQIGQQWQVNRMLEKEQALALARRRCEGPMNRLFRAIATAAAARSSRWDVCRRGRRRPPRSPWPRSRSARPRSGDFDTMAKWRVDARAGAAVRPSIIERGAPARRHCGHHRRAQADLNRDLNTPKSLPIRVVALPWVAPT
jgi:hypothetical protein